LQQGSLDLMMIVVVGISYEDSWTVMHTFGCCYSYLGLQVTSQKFRPPFKFPGAWAGTFACSGLHGVGISCGQEKWDKAKRLLDEIQVKLDSSGHLTHKSLEQKRGFFVHLQHTYPCKGFHLTLDSWRANRDADGWCISPSAMDRSELWEDTLPEWCDSDTQSLAPKFAFPAPRLWDDLRCLLLLLFSPASPPTHTLSSSHILVALYGFGDASGSGFGSSSVLRDGCTLFRHGLWGKDSTDESSNYRELANLVTAIEEGLALGELINSELFIFTDNSMAEGAY
jgi:hypothetical protein